MAGRERYEFGRSAYGHTAASHPSLRVVYSPGLRVVKILARMVCRVAEEVMAMAEIAAFLGISRQRASTLAERADFPRPIAHLTVGRVWSTAEIRDYAARRRAELEGEAG